MAEERGPSKAEVALLRMPKTQLAKQLMKAVRDEDFWSMNLQLYDTPDGPSDERKEVDVNDEDEPELGLELSPPAKRKSGGSIAGQVGSNNNAMMQRVRSPCYTTMPMLRRWASSWCAAVAMSPPASFGRRPGAQSPRKYWR
jgi:hypothetical protein